MAMGSLPTSRICPTALLRVLPVLWPWVPTGGGGERVRLRKDVWRTCVEASSYYGVGDEEGCIRDQFEAPEFVVGSISTFKSRFAH